MPTLSTPKTQALNQFAVALGAFLSVFVFAWLIPPIIIHKRPSDGANATNRVYTIFIDPNLWNYDYVLFQEVYEIRYKKHPWRLLKLLLSKTEKQEMELFSRAGEWDMYCDTTDDEQKQLEYFNQKCEALLHYKQFQGVSLNEIKHRMENLVPAARKWRKKHYPGTLWRWGHEDKRMDVDYGDRHGG
jgi:hypothetical protein